MLFVLVQIPVKGLSVCDKKRKAEVVPRNPQSEVT